MSAPERRLVSTGSPFERQAGYSRAVAVGEWCFVSGTTGYDYAAMAMPEGVCEQAEAAFATIGRALGEAGFAMEDVVRVRYLVADAAYADDLFSVAGRRLGEIRPAATLEVVGLLKPEMKVEIEAPALGRADARVPLSFQPFRTTDLEPPRMTTRKLLLFPGDGIGPEAMAQVEKFIPVLNEAGAGFATETGLVGGAALDAHGSPISEDDMALAMAADAVLFGAVGGPKWDATPYEKRPEAGLLRLRKDMELFANLRPAICYPALADASSLKRELVDGLDILILRELTGGVYFGEPKEIVDLGNGQKRGVDTQIYETYEIERIARAAFELARTRSGRVTSMEKRNVMKTGVLWNEVVTAVHKAEYQDVALDHMLADAGGMKLVQNPKQFDVIVTDNLFGDMLSDIAAMLTGSLGMLPSASLGSPDETTGKRRALYEPVHGSAPDIAGQGIANPIAMIASLAMMLRYSFEMVAEADALERAIASVLESGTRTGDIMAPGCTKVGTAEMGDAILVAFRAELAA